MDETESRRHDGGSGRGIDLGAVRAAVDVLGMTPYDVWLSYYSVGGNASALTVAEWFDGTSAPSAHEYDTLAVSVNETLRDRGLDAVVPYSTDIARRK